LYLPTPIEFRMRLAKALLGPISEDLIREFGLLAALTADTPPGEPVATYRIAPLPDLDAPTAADVRTALGLPPYDPEIDGR
jgi:hypothetical protein